jgi:hypothetical protein
MIKGVNLGNRLVLEKWMSPDLFAGTDAKDETQLYSDLDDVAKRERLTVHRDSYVTERDFAYLANRHIDAAASGPSNPGASGAVNRLLRPDSVRHVSVTTATQRFTAAHHETQRWDKTQKARKSGYPQLTHGPFPQVVAGVGFEPTWA